MLKVAKSGCFTGRISNYVDRGHWTETYRYDVVEGFKTVGFRSNAPAGPVRENSVFTVGKNTQAPSLLHFMSKNYG